jgi:hypothetical protein
MAETPLCPSRPTCTDDLIQRLAGSNCDPKKERRALEAMARSMILIFQDHAELQYVPEASLLSLIVTKGDYEALLLAFANAIIKGTTDGNALDPKLLTHFACVLRRAPSTLYAETAKLGSVLDSLQTRLDKARSRAELETQYHLVCTLSTVLDAMVDIKISGLSRQVLCEPLLKQLGHLRNHQEPRLAQAAGYAYQALRGVPDDESPYQALWRYSYSAIQGTAKVGSAITTMDPMKLIDATPDLINLLSLIKSLVETTQELSNASQDMKSVLGAMKRLSKQRGWYVALRYTDMLIGAKAFKALKDFIQLKPCHEEEPFLCGLYAQLEQAWVTGDPSVKDKVVDLIEETISQGGGKYRRAQEWVRLIAETVGRSSWKDALPSDQPKWKLWKNKEYKPKLKRFPRETTKPENLSTRLLERAWLECGEAQRFYADARICEHYIQGGRLEIKRLSGELLDMKHCYINLAIVELSQEDVAQQPDNKKAEYQPSAFTLFTRLKIEAANMEGEVDLPELFNDRKRDGSVARPKRILIRGRAGVGKTTMCKKIVYDFLCHQMWAKFFDRVLWIPLRKLKGRSSLEEVLHKEYFSMQMERECLVPALWKTICDPSDERTLLILDGLDEVSGEWNDSGTDLTGSLKDLLNRHNVIITSRPCAVNLPGLRSFDLELETVGFHPDQVQAYLSKVVHNEYNANEIWSFINSHWLVHGLVQIPIQLDALCYSWESDFRSKGAPETMTALYQAIELKLWKKDILQLGKKDGGERLAETRVQKMQTRPQIRLLVGSEIELVEFLAFTGLYNDIIEFDNNQRAKIFEQPSLCGMSDDILDRLSFLRTSDSSSKYTDRNYHFIHLAFQEFFAAQYFVRHWQSGKQLSYLKLSSANEKRTTHIQPERFLQKEKYNGRYDIFWRFVAGLLQDSGEEQLRRFFEVLEDKPRDLLGPVHQRILMHCFSEVLPRSCLENLRTGIEAQLKQWALFEYKLQGEMKLCREMEFPEHVLHTMIKEEESEDVKKVILQALQHRSQLSCQLRDLVASFLGRDVSTNLTLSTIDALGKQTALPENIVQAIVSRLEDTDLFVRRSAVKALGKQTALPENIVQAIVSRLEDTDPDVRRSAVKALGKQTALPENILQALAFVISNGASGISSQAGRVLLKQNNLHANFPNFDMKTLRSLYKIWVQQSFGEQLSCYRQGGTFYIDMPDRRREISLVPNKDGFLATFQDEALALGSPTSSLDMHLWR